MKLPSYKIIYFFIFFLFSHIASAQTLQFLDQQVVTHVLPNGMKFLLVKRSKAPLFAAYIRVKVGGADEKAGATGIAHMLEHMAFKGTPLIGTQNFYEEEKLLNQIEEVGVKLADLTQQGKGDSEEAKPLQAKLKELQKQADAYVVKDEFSRVYTKNGASNFNATTSKDVTSYFMELPANKLRLWAYLESERLTRPIFREFYQERDVVMEERRMRTDNDPFGKNYEHFLSTAFTQSPYRDPTIGHARDVQTLTSTKLKQFYQTYYVPQNMVGTIVGDIDLEETKSILNFYFGSIPKGKDPPALVNQEPAQTAERRTSVTFSARPQLMMGFHKPTLPSREDVVFDLIAQLLCEGRSARFYKEIVEKNKIAQTVDCDGGTPGVRLDNLFFIYGTVLGNHTLQELETAIEAELEKLKTQPVTDIELQNIKNKLQSESIFSLNSNMGLASSLSQIEITTGDWRYLLKYETMVNAITPQEIQAVAQKYFQKTNKTISTLGGVTP